MIEGCPRSNEENNEIEERPESENLCCFEKGFSENEDLVGNLMRQTDNFKIETIQPGNTDNILNINKRHFECFEEWNITPWTQKSPTNIWLTSSMKKCTKPTPCEIWLDNVKKKKRIRDCDKLDLALDYTACVIPETFEYQPDSCFYTRFKKMVRGINNQNNKVRMNGFSQIIKGKLKTRADIVNECNEEKMESRFMFQAYENEDNYSIIIPIPRVSVVPAPTRPVINKKIAKETISLPAASAPPLKQPCNVKIHELAIERHKSNSANSILPGATKSTSERVLRRDRIKDSSFKSSVPYVIAESTISLSKKGNKAVPSIPSKCTVTETSENPISCFGKSLSIASVLPAIGLKTQNVRTNSRKK